jgi:small subunit ribosomal protein S1
VKYPSETLDVDEDICVKVLSFDRGHSCVSFDMKQLLYNDPYIDLVKVYPVYKRLINIINYSCFVEIKQCVESLVHVSEIYGTNKNIQPSKVSSLCYVVKVVTVEINEDCCCISLGMMQCVSNPWQNFAQIHNKGENIKHSIYLITYLGIFISCDGGISSLVHWFDIS